MTELYHDYVYLDLIKDVLKNGVEKDDRTGTGTISVFAREMRFNLANGSIPLLTTKKMHTRSIIYELMWYLQGTGSGKYLKENNIRIWNEWMTPDDHLNFVYGYQWRRWPTNEDGTTLIKLRTDKGINLPFKPIVPEQLSVKYDNTKSDDIIGQFIINNEGDEFQIIEKKEDEKNPKYLIQFKDTKSTIVASKPSLIRGQVKDPYKKTVTNEGCIGIIKEVPDYYKEAYNLWYNMMRICHDETFLPMYALYGGSGIFVDQSWRCFANFLHDIRYLPGFNRWKSNPSKYDLDKDYYGSNCYSKDTCVFISSKYNKQLSNLTGFKYVATNKNTGITEEFTVEKEFAEKHNIPKSTICYVIHDSVSHETHGWHFKKIVPENGYVYRKQLYVDQISDVINKLRNNPNDRRMIVSAWNVGQIEDMALPPCHYVFQFYVANGKLSCILNQRSCDVGLGVPFNIVQYSILIHMIAQIVGLEPCELIWRGGDVHIYKNHIADLKEQTTRTPFPSPRLILNKDIKEIDDFKFEDFNIVDYESHPTIKLQVST